MSKVNEMRHVSFRMHVDVHADYLAVATSRGMDLSAVLNWLLVECRPAVLLMKARNDVAMLRAGLAVPLNDPAEVLGRVNEVIGELQDVARRLSASVGSEAA